MEAVWRLTVSLLLVVCCCSLMTPAETTLTCNLKDFAQRLSCYGGLIVVHSVTVSHGESEACVDGVPPTGRLDPALCSSTRLLDIVKTRCNGRYQCLVPMTLCHAAKPCMSRCVRMKTSYSCELGEIRHVCQKQKATLHCGSQLIRVLTANYGRTSVEVCGYSAPRRQPPSTDCRLPEALQLMANRCDGKHSCSVRASNLVFSDPCPGTSKYLQYSFTCLDAAL